MNSRRLHEVAPPVFVAEVYIVYKNEVLMFKRSENKKKFPGFWSIPGGHIDERDDALSAAIREVKEETGLSVLPQDMELKVVALHHHLDRNELYVAFAFRVNLSKRPILKEKISEEGTAQFISIQEAFLLENVFEPVKYYFDHVLNNKPGIIYNNSVWNETHLLKVLSQTIDQNQ